MKQNKLKINWHTSFLVFINPSVKKFFPRTLNCRLINAKILSKSSDESSRDPFSVSRAHFFSQKKKRGRRFLHSLDFLACLFFHRIFHSFFSQSWRARWRGREKEISRILGIFLGTECLACLFKRGESFFFNYSWKLNGEMFHFPL